MLHALALEDGRRWGEVAEPWQVDDARAVLEGESRLHFLTRPRGGSKTSDLAGVALVALLDQLPEASRSYAVAADVDQAGLLTDAAAGFVRRPPGLSRRIDVFARRILNRTSAASLDVLAADEASAYGLLPHLVIVDELAQWRSTPNARGVWAAVISAMAKVAGSRLVVLTTAGDPAHWSAKILDRARTSPAGGPTRSPARCPG